MIAIHPLGTERDEPLHLGLEGGVMDMTTLTSALIQPNSGAVAESPDHGVRDAPFTHLATRNTGYRAASGRVVDHSADGAGSATSFTTRPLLRSLLT